jgi:hypothetical protein
MDYVDCPECLSAARRMPVLSYVNLTDDFFQCQVCHQVCHMPKDGSAPPASLRFAPERAEVART